MILFQAIYACWVLFLTVVFAVFFLLRNKKQYNVVLLSVVPLITLIVFSYVFVFNKGSNVAQLSESQQVWSFWVNAYFPLLLMNFLNLLVIPCFILRSLPENEKQKNFIVRTFLLLSALIGFFHVYLFFPSA